MKAKILFFTIILGLLFACINDDIPSPIESDPSDNPDVKEQPDPIPEPANQPPGTFSLLQIANDSIDVVPAPTFSWQAAIDSDGDPVTYDFYLDREPDPKVKIAGDIHDTTYILPNNRSLSLTRNYFWKVVAKDGKGGEVTSDIFTFKVQNLNDARQVSVVVPFTNRERHASTVFQNKMWVLGGFTFAMPSNQPWGSSEGTHWEAPPVNFEERFTPRYFHAATVFGDTMWVTGGVAEEGFVNDVWMTVDGAIWDSIPQTSSYDKRSEHTLTAFDNKIWIIGGNSSNGQLADVWSSVDGAEWQSATTAAAFGNRNFHQTVAFQGKLWVIGGVAEVGGFKSDVWSSTDGISWVPETEPAEFSARAFHKTLVFDNKIWIVGGADVNGALNDIWYSENGVEWINATPKNSFPVKSAFTTLFFDNKLWVLGGSNTNEVWTIDYHELEN